MNRFPNAYLFTMRIEPFNLIWECSSTMDIKTGISMIYNHSISDDLCENNIINFKYYKYCTIQHCKVDVINRMLESQLEIVYCYFIVTFYQTKIRVLFIGF